MTPNAVDPGSSASGGLHLATVSHGGRFWDVYLELVDDARHPTAARALLCYSPADPAGEERPVRTTAILIERSWEELLARARSLDEHHLLSLLRSCLPDEEPV